MKTVAVSKSKNPVSKKPAEKLEPVKRKVEKVAREISDDSPSEILKKRPSKEALASKNEQNTKKKISKLVKERTERESTRNHEEKAVKESDDNENPVLKKKFDKKEVMRSFRHKVENIQFKINDSILQCTICFLEIKDESVFVCLTCTRRMHWTKSCTGFSESLLTELNEVRNNFLLLCNDCSAIGKRDVVISTICRGIIESETNDLVEKKIADKISDKNDELVTSFKMYSEVITAGLKEVSSSVNQAVPHRGAVTEEQAMIAELEIEKSLKVWGVPELLTGSIAEKNETRPRKIDRGFLSPGDYAECQAIKATKKYHSQANWLEKHSCHLQ